MAILRRKITDYVSSIANVAQTSNYQVFFGGLSPSLIDYLESKGVNQRFIMEEAGLRCSSASIPGSSVATASIAGNYMGVQEKMAHSRIFNELSLEFYVDRDYKIIKFMEHWIDYITSGSESDEVKKSRPGYFYRMRYPTDVDSGYKCNKTKIIKFENDRYGTELEYTFYGLFPLSMSSVGVQYGSSDVLRMSATFSYERYISGKETSQSEKTNSSENNQGGSTE